MKTLAEQIQEKTEQRNHLAATIEGTEHNMKYCRTALEQVEREIVELQKQRDKQPQFGDIVNLISSYDEILGRRVILYDSSGKLQAFNRSGSVVGSASDRYYTDRYYKCTGTNIFIAVKNLLDD